ncbi:GFA family protein [Ancylomarina salipaludis]|uniref:GFA family protein n=2 Tax=Ancylomarina salipaludis TaxID=2501299 RepID=A0A4V1N0B3_9BACT|nr:GFA family protein [Ancylomarina salipaludis]
MKHTGSCLCGKISFEIDGDFESFFLCHCEYCRKDTGSAHAANLFSSTARLKWLSGENQVKTFQYKSTRHFKSFCPNCGSALPNIQIDGKHLVVPAGCLETDVPIQAQAHVFLKSKANWDTNLENLPKFDQFPKKDCN